MQELANRSLDRGITVMEILARLGEATLADIHRESGIPKSSIRRLLATLRARRIVRRSLADGKYRINITMNVGVSAPIPAGAGLLVDIALPVLSQHTRRVGWPSDVQIIDGSSMRMIDSTRPLSPFHLYRGNVNRQVKIFSSATRQACLATMDNEKIVGIIDLAGDDPQLGLGRFAVNQQAFFAALEATRTRGYGVRLRQYRGGTVFEDKLEAIAVPVWRKGQVFGAVSLLFPRGLATTDRIAKQHLASLREAAGEITAGIARFGNEIAGESLETAGEP